ncbi:MAG: ATP-binding protein [Deltaproteobacteria bacterium]|nr:MAG: ATP-binding protein [Deltaproteobacteria bacterium]
MTTDSPERTIEVTLTNQLGYERVAMACSESFAKIFGLAPKRIEDLKTVVAEAAINAMQHGNKGRKDARVTVFMNFKDDAVNVWVVDEGDGIKHLPPKPDIERIMDNLDPPIGFGVFLIKELSDQVEFNATINGDHAVRMSIKM